MRLQVNATEISALLLILDAAHPDIEQKLKTDCTASKILSSNLRLLVPFLANVDKQGIIHRKFQVLTQTISPSRQ